MKSFGKNKRGIELAVNFLVTFILAIVIFGAGLALINTIISGSGQDLDVVQKNLDKKLQALSCSSKDKICISRNEGEAERGEPYFFGVHVNNYLAESMNFNITVKTDSVDAYTRDEVKITEIDIKALPVSHQLTVKPKSQGEKGFAMMIPKDVKKGQYFYTIRVDSADPTKYPSVSETLIFTVK